jgi:hypothetical protein
MTKHSVVDALEQAVHGLLYISETEATLEPFLWKTRDLSDEQLLASAGVEKGTRVERTTLDSFFRTVSRAERPKFEKLAKVIEEQLSEARVYKVGDEAEKMIIVVGKTSDGNWAGVKTAAVET